MDSILVLGQFKMITASWRTRRPRFSIRPAQMIFSGSAHRNYGALRQFDFKNACSRGRLPKALLPGKENVDLKQTHWVTHRHQTKLLPKRQFGLVLNGALV